MCLHLCPVVCPFLACSPSLPPRRCGCRIGGMCICITSAKRGEGCLLFCMIFVLQKVDKGGGGPSIQKFSGRIMYVHAAMERQGNHIGWVCWLRDELRYGIYDPSCLRRDFPLRGGGSMHSCLPPSLRRLASSPSHLHHRWKCRQAEKMTVLK